MSIISIIHSAMIAKMKKIQTIAVDTTGADF
jgi:hypothetical protein